MGHHGRPVIRCDRGGAPIRVDGRFSEPTLQHIMDFVEDVCAILGIPQASLVELTDQRVCAFQRASWLLAGIAVLADWIGSASEHFALCAVPMQAAEYWHDRALPSARAAVAASGVIAPAPSLKTGLNVLFPSFTSPSPMQNLASACELVSGPQLWIVEDTTGSGKTEAALTLAHRLMACGQGAGLYWALPTMATANAMYQRLSEAYQRLFELKSRPSLVLAHSARHLSERFTDSIGLEAADAAPGYESQEDTATAHCAAWLADSRKKALLAAVGVGTIDQALLAVLPCGHQPLRLVGLARNVLVVDEVHASDPYMHTLLCELLAFHASLQGSAILLSATLPRLMRQQLANSFRRGLGGDPVDLVEEAFPLVTHVSSDGCSETPVASLSSAKRIALVEHIPDEDAAAAKLLSAVEHGECAVWVRNTVDDAMDAFDRLAAHLPAARLTLFHARYTLSDRLEIEARVLRAFGKESGAADRRGQLLIATQVVEQSLDLDFDVLVSDLAPVDLLLQRLGRVHRHRRDSLGNPVSGEDQRALPILSLLAPPPLTSPLSDWYAQLFPRGAFVYPKHGQLWLTVRRLLEQGTVRLPDDARPLLESVFGEEAQLDVPEDLATRDERAAGEESARSSLGKLNALKLEEGYRATPNQWLPDTMAPTRLAEPSTTVRLAKWDGSSLEAWAGSGPLAWDLSQLSVRQYLLQEARPETGVLRQAIEAAKQSMPDGGRWSILIPLERHERAWQGHGMDAHGRDTVLTYDAVRGLQFQRADRAGGYE